MFFLKRSIQQTAVLLAVSYTALLGICSDVEAQSIIPDEILDVFDDKCAFSGCHLGTRAAADLDLSEDFAFSVLVNQPSRQKQEIMLVQPADPDNSYLMMKLQGQSGISGDRMPKQGASLSSSELALIANWIDTLPSAAKAEIPDQTFTENFPGLTSATLPTTKTLQRGLLSYRVAHRWRGEIDSGFANLFGLDAGAATLLELAYPIRDHLMFSASRSPINATFELAFKWRFIRQKTDQTIPLSGALYVGVDWATKKQLIGLDETLSTGDGERFAWFLQAPLSRQFGKFSALAVPGILLNHNPSTSDEDPVITLGLTGKYLVTSNFALFAEWVPLLSGDQDVYVVEGPVLRDDTLVYYDSFTTGFEITAGLHVFHIYVTNAMGLSTNQYMSGGNIDFFNGDLRLGFNIYRAFRTHF